ncbi:hypothetical protein AgCh_021158 [Apium graveolens]
MIAGGCTGTTSMNLKKEGVSHYLHFSSEPKFLEVVVGSEDLASNHDVMQIVEEIYLLTTGARESTFRNVKTIAECLADELFNAAKGSSNRMTYMVSWVHLTLLHFKFTSKTFTLDSPDQKPTPKPGVAQGPSLGLPRPKLKVYASPVFWAEKGS